MMTADVSVQIERAERWLELYTRLREYYAQETTKHALHRVATMEAKMEIEQNIIKGLKLS